FLRREGARPDDSVSQELEAACALSKVREINRRRDSAKQQRITSRIVQTNLRRYRSAITARRDLSLNVRRQVSVWITEQIYSSATLELETLTRLGKLHPKTRRR